MEWNKTKYLKEFMSSIFVQYEDFVKSRKYRCKIADITKGANDESILYILISGVKNQIIPYSPQELVVNDQMLDEFSSSDVRAITFLAFKESNLSSKKPLNSLVGQDFENGKTIFIIKKAKEAGEIRKSAHELYSDSELMNEFDQNDIKNIIHTAIMEQAMCDLLTGEE